jgi:hypothetical protein
MAAQRLHPGRRVRCWDVEGSEKAEGHDGDRIRPSWGNSGSSFLGVMFLRDQLKQLPGLTQSNESKVGSFPEDSFPDKSYCFL